MPKITTTEEFDTIELKEAKIKNEDGKIIVEAQYYLIDKEGNKFRVKSFSLSEEEVLTTSQKNTVKNVLIAVENKIKEIEKT